MREIKKILYVHGLGGAKGGSTENNIKEVFFNSLVVSYDMQGFPYLDSLYIKDLFIKENPNLIITSSLGVFEMLEAFLREPWFYDYIPIILINPAMSKDNIESNFGYGKKEYRHKRENGDKYYYLDDSFYNELSRLEKELNYDIKRCSPFKKLRNQIIGVFSKNDEYFF